MTETNSTTSNRGETGTSPLLVARGISKAFPGVQALEDVDLVCRRGRIQALLGENGAGKSTLTAVLTGVIQPDEGDILLEGRPVAFSQPREALRCGVAAVHQEFTLLPHRTVAENVFLGHEPSRRGLVRRNELTERAAELLRGLGIKDPPVNTPVRRLSVAQQQVVEIAKALAHDAKVLFMDEPSAVLAGAELERLFEIISGLADRGVSIVYISHRLAEVDQIADEVVVLRDGRLVAAGPKYDFPRAEIVRRMVGRSLEETFPQRTSPLGEPLLEVKNLLLPGTEPDGLNLHVRAGEIVGVAGMVGSGRSRLGRALVGLGAPSSGSVEIRGEQVSPLTLRKAMSHGVVYIPEDRKTSGLVLDLSVAANVSLPVLSELTRFGVLSRRLETTLAHDTIDRLGIRVSGPLQPTRQLSGGNQQKVVLGKWLAAEPQVLILDEPLRGVDVGAKAEIYAIIRDLAEAGAGILFISSELPEILGLSDRIVVMSEGRIVGELDRDDATEERILELAIGEREVLT